MTRPGTTLAIAIAGMTAASATAALAAAPAGAAPLSAPTTFVVVQGGTGTDTALSAIAAAGSMEAAISMAAIPGRPRRFPCRIVSSVVFKFPPPLVCSL